jgi:16S rRNA (cytosine967-C5)-methyltransferase
VNHLRASQQELVAELVRGGRWARPLGPEHVAVDRAGGLRELRALRDGLCTVQGVAASAAARWLAPQAGERVLDLCSAPGSKACQLAELAEGRASIVAVDISPPRLRLVADNARRLGVGPVWPIAADGCACDRVFSAKFDAAVVDAPCSNTGVLARRVESRWRVTEQRILELSVLQRRLLRSAARVVRPGGRLVYSTCSLEAEENEEAVECLCAERGDYRVEASEYLLPSQTDDDGGYLALLRRGSWSVNQALKHSGAQNERG